MGNPSLYLKEGTESEKGERDCLGSLFQFASWRVDDHYFYRYRYFYLSTGKCYPVRIYTNKRQNTFFIAPGIQSGLLKTNTCW